MIMYSCNSKNHESEYEDYNENVEFDAVDRAVEDGTHSATVEYYNPNTGYSNTYTLDVEVEDGEVNQIDFPNDGYLDEDHIDAEELDEDGNATIEDENGRTFEISIDD
jgi:hypothetical protein